MKRYNRDKEKMYSQKKGESRLVSNTIPLG